MEGGRQSPRFEQQHSARGDSDVVLYHSMSSEVFELVVRMSNGTKFTLELASLETALSSSVLEIKRQIADAHDDTAVDRQRLIYKGRILEDNKTLEECGITISKSTVFLVKSGASGEAKQPASDTGVSTASSATAGLASAPASTPMEASPTSPAFTSHTTPTGNNWMSMMQQQSPPNPEQLQNMMSSPLMQNLLDNPEMLSRLMQSQMDSNPAMARMLEDNPALQHILNDPSALQQAAEWMRNPSALQNALRSQDLQLSQLENMPGGFAALSNLYRNMQVPLEESMQADAPPTRRTDHSSNEGAAGTAMPNPWSSSNNAFSSSSTSPASQPNNSWASMIMDQEAPTMASRQNALGLPPAGSPEHMEMALQMLDNPFFSEMMQQAVRENPDAFRQMLEQQDPTFRAMFANNPEAANQMVQTMMDPNMIRQMIHLQQSMGPNNPWGSANQQRPDLNNLMRELSGRGLGGGSGANPWTSTSSSQTSSVPPSFAGGLDMSSLMQQMMQNQQQPNPWSSSPSSIAGGGVPLDFNRVLQQAAQNPPSGSSSTTGLDFSSILQPRQSVQIQPLVPADRYSRQLASLHDMGFDDEQQNLAVLETVHGHLNRAVDMLLAGEAPAVPNPVGAEAAPAPTSETQDVAPPPKDDADKKND